MSSNALEKIQAIQDEADKKIAALKAEAVSELVKRLSDAKAAVASLEDQYEKLTGKTVRGESVSGTRKRLTKQEKDALVIRCADIIKAANEGLGMRQIVEQSGESVSSVREAVSRIKGIKKTGNKASTQYSLK